MSETEKITINLSVVDLGRIDLLAEQGFYATRTDFIRTAIRILLDSHNEVIQETVTRKSLVIGITGYGKRELEEREAKNEQLDIRVLGMLHINEEVDPELALATINSVKVLGVFNASPQVKAALADRIL
jgi:Arc/MetJ-type ribon-helix-helix transcriptional regulator